MRRIASLAATVALAAGCTTTVSGTGSVDVPPGGSTPSDHPRSAGPAEPLVDKVIDPPAGATPWHTPWARNRTPTPRQFVAHVYRPGFVNTQVYWLEDEGIRHVAHATWYAPDRDQVDMVLLQFDSVEGAVARYRSATDPLHYSIGVGIKSFAVPGKPHAVAYYDPHPDQLGNVRAYLYCRVGAVVIEEFYFSPGRIRTHDAIAWMRAQRAALK